jgi:hypothetical protein
VLFVPQRLEKFDAGHVFRGPLLQPLAHCAEPAKVRETLFDVVERRLRRRSIGDRG